MQLEQALKGSLSGGKCYQSDGNPAKRGAKYLYVIIIFACFYDCHSQQEQYLTLTGHVEICAVIS